MFGLIWLLMIGLAAGCAATWMMESGRTGWLPVLAVGVLGSFVGGVLFRMVGFRPESLLGELIAATVGAMACIYAIRRWGGSY